MVSAGAVRRGWSARGHCITWCFAFKCTGLYFLKRYVTCGVMQNEKRSTHNAPFGLMLQCVTTYWLLLFFFFFIFHRSFYLLCECISKLFCVWNTRNNCYFNCLKWKQNNVADILCVYRNYMVFWVAIYYANCGKCHEGFTLKAGRHCCLTDRQSVKKKRALFERSLSAPEVYC